MKNNEEVILFLENLKYNRGKDLLKDIENNNYICDNFEIFKQYYLITYDELK